MPAKSRKVAILCLGADVELTLTPQEGFRTPVPDADATPASIEVPPSRLSHAVPVPLSMDDDFEPYDPMDEDESIDAGLLSEVHEVATSVSAAIISAPAPNSQNASTSSSAGKKDDVIFLTLVHGDMVLLEGDNFNVGCNLLVPSSY